jgi:tetratricopeptide (TPR) repeat protein
LEARETKAKFLLTSRRDERAWLSEMPIRVVAPAMPMQERLQFAGAIAEHRGKRLADLPDLTSLLQFTQGNPLTILVSVGEALRAGIDTKDQLEAFVAALRGGEGKFEDEATEGRTKSLGASLSYGFGSAFSQNEQRLLALLHLFQGFVDVDTMRWMGNPESEWVLEEVRGLTRTQSMDLLNRAAEIGLLVPHGDGYYSTHPGLSWYFRDLFARNFAGEKGERARRAFVEGMGVFARDYVLTYEERGSEVLPFLLAQEDNLLAAWHLAHVRGWWRELFITMGALRYLYVDTGRASVWRGLLVAVTPDFVDAHTGLPRPGREEEWSLFTEYRVDLAEKELDLVEAERLQRLRVDWDRKHASSALMMSPEQRTNKEIGLIGMLAASIQHLGNVQRERREPNFVDSLGEAFNLFGTIGAPTAQAQVARAIGEASNDLDTAEKWLQLSLEKTPPHDTIGRSASLNALGKVFLMRYADAKDKRKPEDSKRWIFEAAKQYDQALMILPPTAVTDKARVYTNRGNLFAVVGGIDRALQDYQKAIRYLDQSAEVYLAGQTRYNVAVVLMRARRLDDARLYAEAALANFRTVGVAAQTQMAERMIADIDGAAAEQKGNT